MLFSCLWHKIKLVKNIFLLMPKYILSFNYVPVLGQYIKDASTTDSKVAKDGKPKDKSI